MLKGNELGMWLHRLLHDFLPRHLNDVCPHGQSIPAFAAHFCLRTGPSLFIGREYSRTASRSPSRWSAAPFPVKVGCLALLLLFQPQPACPVGTHSRTCAPNDPLKLPADNWTDQPAWTGIQPEGFPKRKNPHVQSFVIATDQTGLKVTLEP
jgi:hypothetical protein